MKAHPLLEVNDLKKYFPLRRGLFGGSRAVVHAADAVSFTIDRGETLSLVGESGCGKSTVGKAILRLFPLTEGQVILDGNRIDDLSDSALRPLRRRIQVVFQDPFSSLNPRMRIRDSLAEPLVNFGLAGSRAEIDEAVGRLLERVGLSRDAAKRWPHEFSGGQRQRIGIARALAVKPDFLVCDESVAALDVSIQAQIINLFMDLRRDLNLTYLFISHDLGVVQHIADRVVIMYLGRVVETAPTETLFSAPRHPYTQALLHEMPRISTEKRAFGVIKGEIPSPLNPPQGCHFHPRCPFAMPRCKAERPLLRPAGDGVTAACHLLDK